MGIVRSFTEEDIPRVIELNSQSFPESASLSREAQEHIFREVCFHNPWYDPDISSLVHEEPNGAITGFLGIVPRRMVLGGRIVRVAVGQHLMVNRSTLASVQLFRKFLDGPQDFSMTDMAVDVAKTMWERLGGTTIGLHSIYWRRPLRPAGFTLSFLKGGIPSFLTSATKPAWRTIDALLNRIPNNPFRLKRTDIAGQELTVDEFLKYISLFTEKRALQPVYDQRSISWLFSMLKNDRRFGSFQKIMLRDHENNILGWYIYYLNKGGRSEVIQVVGLRTTITNVIDHLFYHAWRGGAVELCARLDPRFMKEYSDKFCLFMPGRNWMLVHSRQPEIIQTIQMGDAFLTRLEGDLWFF